MSKSNKICIYHSPCDDGFACSYIMRQKLGPIEIHKGNYSVKDVKIDFKNKEVYLADFSYSREKTIEIAKLAKKVIILDHHKTAIDRLKGLDKEFDNIELVFSEDNSQSGVGVTWDYFFPGRGLPRFLKYIQDRDLFSDKYAETNDISTALRAYPYNHGIWKQFFKKGACDKLQKEGKIINKFLENKMKEIIKQGLMTRNFDGYLIPVLNAPWFLSSDLGFKLSLNRAFSAIYSENETGRKYSLRSSNDNGVDVSEIADKFGKKYGGSGGGHRNASGFEIPRHKIRKFEEDTKIE